MTWAIWRHRNDHAIRYWVETDLNTERPRIHFDSEEYLVRIKSVRNVAFDDEDYPSVEMAPLAGMWPYESFLELYEPEG